MRRAGAALAALAALSFASAAHAEDAVRVVLAGPKKDPVAARLERELVALGYAPVTVGELSCTSSAIQAAVKDAGASAALCSESGRVEVWTDDGKELKLRDMIIARSPHAAETIAMQAAEVMRANIAFREPEPTVAEVAKPAPAPKTGEWDDFDRNDRPSIPPDPVGTASFIASAGASYLMSSGASLGGLSLNASLGIHRRFSLSAHVDAPLMGTQVTPMTTQSPIDNSRIRAAPGIAGVGIEVPFTPPSSFVVPRLGASAGVAWLYAAKTAGFRSDTTGGPSRPTPEISDVTFAPAAWVSAAFSFRVRGPIRIVADGLIGATAGGITINTNVNNASSRFARWGVPLASAGLRAELSLP